MSLTPEILVVDDEVFLCLSLARLLRKHGYRALCVSNGFEAIQVLTEAPARFALALIDLHMPDMSGEETAMRLKAIAPLLKIAMMTGYSPNFAPPTQEGHAPLPPPASGETLLFKPFENGAVIATVKRLIS